MLQLSLELNNPSNVFDVCFYNKSGSLFDVERVFSLEAAERAAKGANLDNFDVKILEV